MVRPTLLVAETEPVSALSVRKLVLETAKFNVLTAHSQQEALEIFDKAPELVSALAVVIDLKGAESLVAQCKRRRPGTPVICISPNEAKRLKGADHHVSSHHPESLIDLCRELFGDPRSIDSQSRGSE
jgi:DNA-binding response OmpR family regulator